MLPSHKYSQVVSSVAFSESVLSRLVGLTVRVRAVPGSGMVALLVVVLPVVVPVAGDEAGLLTMVQVPAAKPVAWCGLGWCWFG